jgi:hypothetical protein
LRLAARGRRSGGCARTNRGRCWDRKHRASAASAEVGEEGSEADPVPDREPPTRRDDGGTAPDDGLTADEDALWPRAPVAPRRTARRPRKGRQLRLPEEVTRHTFTPEQRLLLLDTWRRSGLPGGDFAALVGLPALRSSCCTRRVGYENDIMMVAGRRGVLVISAPPRRKVPPLRRGGGGRVSSCAQFSEQIRRHVGDRRPMQRRHRRPLNARGCRKLCSSASPPNCTRRWTEILRFSDARAASGGARWYNASVRQRPSRGDSTGRPGPGGNLLL